MLRHLSEIFRKVCPAYLAADFCPVENEPHCFPSSRSYSSTLYEISCERWSRSLTQHLRRSKLRVMPSLESILTVWAGCRSADMPDAPLFSLTPVKTSPMAAGLAPASHSEGVNVVWDTYIQSFATWKKFHPQGIHSFLVSSLEKYHPL